MESDDVSAVMVLLSDFCDIHSSIRDVRGPLSYETPPDSDPGESVESQKQIENLARQYGGNIETNHSCRESPFKRERYDAGHDIQQISKWIITFIAGGGAVALLNTGKPYIVGWKSRRLIKGKATELPLWEIESIEIRQGPVGRILDYGSVVVHTRAKTAGPFRHVAQPFAFKRISRLTTIYACQSDCPTLNGSLARLVALGADPHFTAELLGWHGGKLYARNIPSPTSIEQQ